MFEGFWSWPLSQKFFGVLWLVMLGGLIFTLAAVLYAAT